MVVSKLLTILHSCTLALMVDIKMLRPFAALFLIWIVIVILCVAMISKITQTVIAVAVVNTVYIFITSLTNLFYLKYEQVGSAIKIAIHMMNTVLGILTAIIIGATVHYASVDMPSTVIFICFALVFAIAMLFFQLDAINYRRWKLGYEYITDDRSDTIA